MKKHVATLIALVALLMSIVGAHAEEKNEPQPIRSRWMISVGYEEARDNYLSIVKFTGTNYALQGEWEKMFASDPNRVGMTFDGAIEFGSMLNKGMTQRMYDLGAEFGWGMFRNWKLDEGWTFKLGGRTGLDAGLLYLMGNGNNPVSARGAIDLSLTGSVGYAFKIKGKRLTLSDSFRMPIAGIFFSPQYGESYYEIYLGNRHGLVHFGNPGNRFCIENRLAVAYPVSRRYTLEAGYQINYQSRRTNNLTMRIARHSFVLGLTF